MRTLLLSAVAGLGLCFVPAPVAAEDKPSDADTQFVLKVSACGLAEVDLGKLAAKRAASEDVRKFGRQMAEDHTKAGKQLQEIAAVKKYAGASAMDRDHRALFDRLSKMEGAAFDREYLAGQLKDHEEAVRLFEAESKNGSDEQLKAWVDKTLPTLREHLKMARELWEKNKG